ncbi:copper homeostasis protein CutC [Nocardia sp. AG03]|uniref:copper homeostasis protein CutC n=1 Tax=Nocardia sp. AG03 TaxID=3025312 RepID=UPI002418A87E|nr:copper homeostasis protein CutC [Nocardia sp. AG03]
MTALEFAVQDVAGARLARQLGADRVELCSALGGTGGITPSLGLIEGAVATGVPVHVLIRCRPGDFVYDEDELAVMAADAVAAMQAGAAGVVVGALTEQREVDVPALERLVEGLRLGQGELTFHRAVDQVSDQFAALDVLRELGFRRVLSSGGAPSCVEGLGALAALVEHADRGVEVMAGGGVRVADIAALRNAGVDAIHLSARRVVAGDAGPGGGDAPRETLDVTIATAAVAAVREERWT